MSYYDLLGVNHDATQSDIKKAYHKLARIYHPDKSDDPSAEEVFQRISQAYAVLSDEESRQKYDVFGENFDEEDEIFYPTMPQEEEIIDEDLNIFLKVHADIADIYCERSRTVRYQRLVDGYEVEQEEEIPLHLPELTLKFMGNQIGEQFGDLHIKIVPQPDPVFDLIGYKELRIQKEIPLKAVYTGFIFKIKHLTGEQLSIRVEPKQLVPSRRLTVNRPDGTIHIDFSLILPEEITW